MTNALCELSINDRDFKVIQKLIYELAGIVISDAKRMMVQGRLSKRLRALSLHSYSDYLAILQDAHSQEKVQFVNALTTNKTDFFRERHHFDYLAETVFPRLEQLSKLGDRERRLRIWCSASSTGEEPYSIAIAIREFFGLDSTWDLRILASDIDTSVLDAASRGEYDEERFQDLPPQLIKKYFNAPAKGASSPWVAKPTLRDLITFRRINLHDAAWPIHTGFDVIFCRNVLIYFDSPSQRTIVHHFADYLLDDGYLMLGHSESLIGVSSQFKSIGDTIYQKSDAPKYSSKRGAATQAAWTTHKPRQAVQSRVAMAEQTSHTADANNTAADIQVGPNAFIVSDRPAWISATLGSGVAVCLHDSQAGIGGVTHIDPSHDLASSGLESNRRDSIEQLMRAMLEYGADRSRLVAKIFGGSSEPTHGRLNQGLTTRTSTAFHEAVDPGQANVEEATLGLKANSIPITASFVGQDCGMHIRFNTRSAKVLVDMLKQK